MGSGAQPILRIPLILFAIADLAMLGSRLWPWPNVLAALPPNGAAGIDPAVCLLAYAGIFFWLGGNRHDPFQKALGFGAWLGFLGGLLLVAEILIKAQAAAAGDPAQSVLWTRGLFIGAVLLWGVAGLSGARATGNDGVGMTSGLWSAMVSGLMAAAAALGQMSVSVAPPASQNPWNQYEGLAIGNYATQTLVHSLNSVTFYLLVGPLMGAAAGLLFALFGNKGKA
jgi:hypothetical protein